MLRLKRMLAGVIAIIMVIAIAPTQGFASGPELVDLTNSSKQERQQIMNEVNEYMDEHQEPFALAEFSRQYLVPLSNGKYIGVETTLEHLSTPAERGEYIDANLGSWRYGYAFVVSNGKVDIHIIYYVNSTVAESGELDFEFTSSGIQGTPAPLCQVYDEAITDEGGSTNYCYSEGYVSISYYIEVPVVYYADLTLLAATNDPSDSHYGEIVTDFNISLI